MFSWVNVYMGYDRKKFYQILDALEIEKIQCKTKSFDSSRDRMNRNVIMGGNPLIMNTIGMNHSVMEEFKIWVKKENVEKAQSIIYTLQNQK